jgi:DnaK suppressor protein
MVQKKKTVKKAAKTAAKKKTKPAKSRAAGGRKVAAKKTVKAKAKKTAAKKKTSKAAPKKATAPKKAKAPKAPLKKSSARKAAPVAMAHSGPDPAFAVAAVENRPIKRKLSQREKKFVEIKQVLIGQKEALLSEAETAINSLPEQTVFADLGDQATAESDRNFMLRLRGREQRLLNKIEEAMERIDTGAFGVCDSCGEEISLERLRARPVATLCIDCKEEQEEEEKLQGS